MASPEHYNLVRETADFLGEHWWKILIAWVALGAAVAPPIGKRLKERRLQDTQALDRRDE